MDASRQRSNGAHPALFRLAEHEFSVAAAPEVLRTVERLFAGCRTDRVGPRADAYEIRPSRGNRGNVELLLRGTRLARGPVGAAIDRLTWDASSRAFACASSLFVHAGVVSRGGRGVMLPAPPDHGKSTTVAALVRAGFDFLSDEAAALDPADGMVHPFPRPVSLSTASLHAVDGSEGRMRDASDLRSTDQHTMAPDDLRPGALGSACRITFIVAPSYQADARTRLEPMGRPEMLRLLVEQSFNLVRFGADGFRLLGDVTRDADCYRLTIGDLPSAVDAIEALFEKVEI